MMILKKQTLARWTTYLKQSWRPATRKHRTMNVLSVKACMPKLRINHNNSRTVINYDRFPQKSVAFSNLFFPFFSKLWSSLNKNIKCNSDLISFKENLSAIYKPVKNVILNIVFNPFTSWWVIFNFHRFVTGLSNPDICLNCNENKTENISHFVMPCPSFSLPRESMFNEINKLLPNFSSLSNKEKLFILLNVLNTVDNIADCRNVPIMFAMQTYILSTKRFEKQP